jgi:hypothetical protein
MNNILVESTIIESSRGYMLNIFLCEANILDMGLYNGRVFIGTTSKNLDVFFIDLMDLCSKRSVFGCNTILPTLSV